VPDIDQTEQQQWDAVLAEDSKLQIKQPEVVEAEAAADTDLENEEPIIVEATPKVDPMDELKEHLKRIEENNAKMQRDLNGRFGGLADQMKQIAKEATVARATAAPAEQAAIKEASKTPEKWAEFKKEWEGSSLVESIEEYVALNQKDPTERIQSEVAKAKEELNRQYAEREQRLQSQIVDLTMNQAHPGWKKTVNSPEFNAWRTAAPAAVQALAQSDKPEDAISMLDQFKDATAPAAAKVDKVQANKDRLREAVNPTRSEVAPRKTLSIEDMTEEQFWAYEARIQAAKQKNAA
jgi:hypothetical protein